MGTHGLLWIEWQTDTTEDITVPQLRRQVVIMCHTKSVKHFLGLWDVKQFR